MFITVLEVYQFARDAAVAEGWLMTQENYLTSHELGVRCFNKSSINSPVFMREIRMLIFGVLELFSKPSVVNGFYSVFSKREKTPEIVFCYYGVYILFTETDWNCFRSQNTIDEVENLIKKHEAFEKSAAAQEERFAALERLTTVRKSWFCVFIFSLCYPYSVVWERGFLKILEDY